MLMPLVLTVALAVQAQTDTTVAVRSGARLSVENFGGSVTIRTWDRSQVRVQAAHGRRDRIEVESTPSVVRIEAARGVGSRGFAPAVNVDYTITIPAWLAVQVEGVNTSADIEGVSGEVSVETVQGDVRVIGGSGRIALESVQGQIVLGKAKGRIDVSTVNRGIHISDVEGDIVAETVNGPIVIERVQSRTVDAATVNGTVVYDGTLRSGGDYAFATHNGGIWVVVPNGTDATVSVSTFNGKFDSSFPVNVDTSNRRRFSFALGNGNTRIDLESFGGDIRLRRPGEDRPGFGERQVRVGNPR